MVPFFLTSQVVTIETIITFSEKEARDQLSFFTAAPPLESSHTQIIDELQEINANKTSLLNALQKILEWQQSLD